MSNEIPERELADLLVGEHEDDEPGPSSIVSPETGTVYDDLGEPEVTPHDVEPEDDEDT